MSSHIEIEPAILYLGTPVVLISSRNEDGTANLAPMSSAFWLGWRTVLGLGAASQTTRNLIREGEGVLNLPSVAEAAAVDRLARTTGTNPVPPLKVERGYRYEKDKFGISGLTAAPAVTVKAPRVVECPVNLEVVVEDVRSLAAADEELSGHIMIIEARVQRVHIHPEIAMEGHDNRIDPDLWRPLIMSFQKLYGLGDQVHPSTLAKISEHLYRSPDVDRSHQAAQLTGA